MAFKKLSGIDGSDLRLWASSSCAIAFLREIGEQRESALRNLIKSPTEGNAAIVRAFDKVESLMNEARNLK